MIYNPVLCCIVTEYFHVMFLSLLACQPSITKLCHWSLFIHEDECLHVMPPLVTPFVALYTSLCLQYVKITVFIIPCNTSSNKLQRKLLIKWNWDLADMLGWQFCCHRHKWKKAIKLSNLLIGTFGVRPWSMLIIWCLWGYEKWRDAALCEKACQRELMY